MAPTNWSIYLMLFTLLEGALCQNKFDKDRQNKKAMERIRNRLNKDRAFSYAVLGTSEAVIPIAMKMASIADEISHSTCVQIIQEESSALADMLVRQTGNDCSFELRDIDYTTYVDKCNTTGSWVVDKLLIYYLGMREQFRYQLYKETNENTLWFMEISNLNQVFECPCKDDIPTCEFETSCGRTIGKCRATCGVCPYYDFHI